MDMRTFRKNVDDVMNEKIPFAECELEGVFAKELDKWMLTMSEYSHHDSLLNFKMEILEQIDSPRLENDGLILCAAYDDYSDELYDKIMSGELTEGKLFRAKGRLEKRQRPVSPWNDEMELFPVFVVNELQILGFWEDFDSDRYWRYPGTFDDVPIE